MTEEEVKHYNFIHLTDRRALYTQLKGLVSKAQQIANAELKMRRNDMQKLLETEDKVYEEEFANKVKSRIDTEIKERKETLFKIKEANKLKDQAFLKEKRIQQYMNNCYEIRDALRYKELLGARECLIEQIEEKQREHQREKEMEEHWVKVTKANQQLEDQRHASEPCLRKKLAKQNKEVLDHQMWELEQKRAEERAERQQEIDRIAKVMEEIRLEEFDRKRVPVSLKKLQYRDELLADIEKRRLAHLKERELLADEHRQLIKDIQREEAEAKAMALANKRAMHLATLEYISYVKRMRRLDQYQHDMRNARHDDLSLVDQCTKTNIQHMLQRKAEMAAANYAVLKRQVCEEQERRLREELERKENKIFENRFAPKEKSRDDIKQERLKMRDDLDKQIVELNRIRRMEEEKYAAELLLASNDQEFCEQLAKRVISEGIDYLEPHANWKILKCPNKEYELVEKAKKPYPDCSELAEGGYDKPRELCGCEARYQRTLCGNTKCDGRGDAK